jgi:hypothetical protein
MQIRLWAVLFLVVLVLAGASRAGAQSPAPRIFFTDLDSGPNSGGEGVGGFAGAYVTLYGNFFGTTQGTSTVTWNGQNCLRVVPPTGAYTGWGMSKFWYQQMVVQIGASCTPGTGNFAVTTPNGTSNGMPFTVRAIGNNHIYFAATTGNDGNAGTIASPLRTIAGCKNKAVAGDICYIEGGVVQNSTDGSFGAALDMESSGSAGLPIALGAYPGASPQPKIDATCCTYGIRVPNLGGNTSNYWNIFGISIYSPNNIGFNIRGTNWKIVNDYLTCPGFNGAFGCFEADQSSFVYIYGWEESGNGVSPASIKQAHSLYIGTDTNHAWVGWSYIHDNFTCRAIQAHSSPVGAGTGNDLFDLHIHDNKILNDNCEGINFATVDPSKGVVEAYNNVIWHTGNHISSDGGGDFACIVNPAIVNAGTAPPATPPVQVYNNTCFDIGSVGTADGNQVHGAIGNATPPNMTLSNNIIQQLSGEFYLQQAPVRQTGLSGLNNDWFGVGAAPTMFSNNLNVDPLFVAPSSTSAADFHLQSGSPMIGAGSSSLFSATDIDGKPRPNPPSVGAYEFAAGTGSVQKPNPPTNLAVTVQ